MSRQALSTDNTSGIDTDAKRYTIETVGDPAYAPMLLLHVIRVSIEAQSIFNRLRHPEDSSLPEFH